MQLSTRGLALLLAPTTLLAAGCSGDISAPLPAAQIRQFATSSGRHLVEFQWINGTDQTLTRPKISTSCGCHDVEFEPSEVAPGETATIRIAQDSAIFPVRGDARVQWSPERTDKLEWVILQDRRFNLSVAPARVNAETIARAGSFELSFVANYPDGKAPTRPELSATANGEPLEIVVADIRGDGPDRFRGHVQVRVPNAEHLTGAIELVASGLASSSIQVY